jgi:hypothetical protein
MATLGVIQVAGVTAKVNGVSSDDSAVVVEVDGSSVKLTAADADASKISSSVCAFERAPRRGAA